MRGELERILREYTSAREEAFAAHRLAAFIRGPARDAVKVALGSWGRGLKVTGKPGQGAWADSPWLGVLDPTVTMRPTEGYYVCYLFPQSMTHVSLSLQLGTEAMRGQLGSEGTRASLRHVTRQVRERVPEAVARFGSESIRLEPSGTNTRAAFYELAHAFGKTYPADLPPDTELREDLREMVRFYRLLTFRGGLGELPQEGNDECMAFTGEEDRRRFRLHRRIERNATLAEKAKKVHGYTCQACGLNLEERYGEFGHEYIEAHHLTPLSELPEDKPAKLDVRRDFAVLCPNCHRMIHRPNAPPAVEIFKTYIRHLDR